MELIQIRKQYERIPTFQCKEGCTDCCGPVPFTEAEWKQLPTHQPLIAPVCQYKGPTGCAVYEQRPLLCRLYGTVDDEKLLCPHGCRPSQLLTKQQGRTIIRHYLKHPLAQDPAKDLTWATSLLRR